MQLRVSRTVLVAALVCLAASCADPGIHDGRWRAWLDSPGGDLPFGLELAARDGRAVEAWIVNGPERIAVGRVLHDGDRLELGFEPYDSNVVATVSTDGRRLDGRWSKTGAGGEPSTLAFHARADNAAPRTAPEGPSVAGRWAVDFERSGAAVGLFEAPQAGGVTGTFLTTTGDYRYLDGTLEDGRLRLSCFDGAHAFLFDARLDADRTLSGDFWSRDTWHERWTGRLDPAAALPDGFELTRWIGGRGLGEMIFPDLDGRPRSLADPQFGGRALILEIFGSWCPNCNDAAVHLGELHREYRGRGLSIVGLAFELTGEFERDAAQVRRYAELHGLEFPMLLAGTSDKAEASKSFPLLDRVRSFPTTIFLDGEGRVRAVHQGYSGPATGQAHRELKERFAGLVEELLAGRPGPA